MFIDKAARWRRNGDVRIVPGFKQKRHGSLLFCHQDSLNTDGIFAGTHTYNEELTLEMISKVVMENYDPNFSKLLQRGDVLVGGFNFGCGSSREQAATSLKLLGIDVIIAGSFSETYKRNAFNNGLLCIEIPDLVLQMKNEFGTGTETVRTGWECSLDFATSSVSINAGCTEGNSTLSYAFTPLGEVVQSLIAAGSLEALIRRDDVGRERIETNRYSH